MNENNQTQTIQNPKNERSFLVALLLSIFLGNLGIDRFYMGYTGLGILKLLTGGGCLIWYLIDIILIVANKIKDADGNPLRRDDLRV